MSDSDNSSAGERKDAKKRTVTVVRHVVQVVALLVFIAPALVAGWALFGATTGGDAAMGTPAELPFYGTLSSSTVGGITLIAILLVELFWGHRVWCRAICPLGGFYEVVGKVGLVNVAIDHDKCIGCNACKRACLCDPEILDAVVAGEDAIVRAGDCMACGKCTEACPTGALSFKLGR